MALRQAELHPENWADIGAYARDCLRIRTKSSEIVPLVLNRAQQIAQSKIEEQYAREGKIRALILKARQEGISTWVAARNYRAIHLTKNLFAMVIADEKDRGGELFEMYNRFDEKLPSQVKLPRGAYLRRTQLVLDHGNADKSSLIVQTANDAAAGRAITIHRLHGSEIAFWKNPEEVMVGLMQAVPDFDTEVILETTANGVGGYFHELWSDEDNGWLKIFLPWWIHEEYVLQISESERDDIILSQDPYEREAQDLGFELDGVQTRLTPEQLAWRRAKIRTDFRGDSRMFRQEFPSTPREAFLVSGTQYFDEEDLLRHETRAKTVPMLFRGDIKKRGPVLRPVKREFGWLRIWEFPRKNGRYVIGADTAEGKMVGALRDSSEKGGNDFNCAYVLDANTGRFVACLHGRMAPEVFAEDLANTGYFYSSQSLTSQRSPAYVGVESDHSSGQTVLKYLREVLKYPRLHYHYTQLERTKEVTQKLGWTTNMKTRMPMLDAFSHALRTDMIWVPDPNLIKECFTFVRGDDGKPQAQDGSHDDRVMSAAITIALGEYAPSNPSALPKEPEYPDTPTGWADYDGKISEPSAPLSLIPSDEWEY